MLAAPDIFEIEVRGKFLTFLIRIDIYHKTARFVEDITDLRAHRNDESEGHTRNATPGRSCSFPVNIETGCFKIFQAFAKVLKIQNELSDLFFSFLLEHAGPLR